MAMNRIGAALLLALSLLAPATSVRAQTPDLPAQINATLADNQRGAITASALRNLMLNVTGTLSSQVAGKAPLASPTFTGMTTAPSVNVPGSQSILYQPLGNPLNTYGSLVMQAPAKDDASREFAAAFTLIANKGRDATNNAIPGADKVALYVATQSDPGSGNSWGVNLLTTLAPGLSPLTHWGVEHDHNNLYADFGAADGATGMSAPFDMGYELVTSGTYKGTAAFNIRTANANQGWFRGYGVDATNPVAQASFYDYGNAAISHDIRGTHAFGIDLRNGTFSGAPIRLKAGDYIKSRNVGDTADTPLIGVDGNGNTKIDAATNVVMGKTVIEPFFTPASSTATCTVGTRTQDASYVYVCVATNTWKRAALSTW